MFRTIRLCAALLLLSAIAIRPASALTVNVIPITGQLLVGGSPVTGNYDLTFQLYSAVTGGSTVGPLVTVTNVAVADGVFYVEANFGALSLGNPLFVQTSYRVHPVSGNPAYTALTPRHTVPSVVYAAYTPYASFAGNTNTIAGQHIKTTVPTTGQALIFTGGFWTPTTLLAPTDYTAGAGLMLTGSQFAVAVPLSLSTSNANPILTVTNSGSGVALEAIQSGGDDGIYASGGNDGIYASGGAYGIIASGPVGIYGVSSTSAGTGVEGLSGDGTGVSGTSNNSYGVYGSSSSGIGVYGISSSSDAVLGVFGAANGPLSYYAAGVKGDSTTGNGVMGISSASGGYGVLGIGNTNASAGVVGVANGSRYAGYFDGDVSITGTLSKSAGSFKIDDPIDPANKYLSHSFVESPDMMNIYNGVITLDSSGAATVTLPAWFEALNKEFRYQLTCVGGFAPVYIGREVTGNTFEIAGGRPGLKVSWQVTGIRHDAYADAHRIPVEEDKAPADRGHFLSPAIFGQPDSMSLIPKQVSTGH